VENTAADSASRIRTTVWIALLLMAILAWVILYQQSVNTGSMGAGLAAMGLEPVSFLLFLPLWIAMRVAMMFPAVAPVVSLFAVLSAKRRTAGQKAAPTWILVAGYLSTWTLFGVLAYLLSLIVPALGMMAAGLRVDSPVAAGIVLTLAGLYQLTPLKQVCLHHCRSPIIMFLNGWREGRFGAFRMGITHGAYCVGCCWGLMLVLFAVGLMNLGWMVVLAIAIFLEKVLRHGSLLSRVTAVALVLFGVFTIVAPWIGAGG
jgi:predicted metal-binding membrane protein